MNLDFHERFKRIIGKLEESGNAYANAKADSWYSQEMCSSIKASLMMRSLEGESKMSLAKAEILAKSSPVYIEHLKETREKIRQENLTRSEWKKWDASFEGNRSLSSLEKRTQELIGD
jgi:hypothetical protein